MSTAFHLQAPFPPKGDQPQAIESLVASLQAGHRFTTLLGATGTGKTFTMAATIARLGRPALVISPNKTLAAQLTAEFREFFPDNAVEFFVSYFDYYQPEAYIPQSDTYIEKDSAINQEVERLRHSATQAVLERPDTLVVASVSCIYGLGNPEDYRKILLVFRPGEQIPRDFLLHRLVEMFFTRTNQSLDYGTFRLQGETLEIHPVDEARVYRIEFFGDEVERMQVMDPVTGEILGTPTRVVVYPAKHYVTPVDKMQRALQAISEELEGRLEELKGQGKLLEAQRLEMRTRYDLEVLGELGYCNGIENYSRHLTAGPPETHPTRCWITSLRASWSSWTSPTWRFRSCEACWLGTARARAPWWSSASASPPPTTIAHWPLKSSSRRWGRSSSSLPLQGPTNCRSLPRLSSRSSAPRAWWTPRWWCAPWKGRSMT